MVNNPLSNEKSMYSCRSDRASRVRSSPAVPAVYLDKPESGMFRLVQRRHDAQRRVVARRLASRRVASHPGGRWG